MLKRRKRMTKEQLRNYTMNHTSTEVSELVKSLSSIRIVKKSPLGEDISATKKYADGKQKNGAFGRNRTKTYKPNFI